MKKTFRDKLKYEIILRDFPEKNRSSRCQSDGSQTPFGSFLTILCHFFRRREKSNNIFVGEIFFWIFFADGSKGMIFFGGEKNHIIIFSPTKKTQIS